MITRFCNSLGLLRLDTRGASVIEVALFMPFLAMMVMGIIDSSLGFARKIAVEQSIYRALEKVAVGSVKTDYNFLKAEVAAGADVPETAVTVDPFLECNRVRQPSFTGVCPTGQEVARYVAVSVSTTYTPEFEFGPLAQAYGNAQGNIPIQAEKSLRIQ